MNELLNITGRCNASGATDEMAQITFLVTEEKKDSDKKQIVSHQIGIIAMDLDLCKKFDPKKKYNIVISEL